MSARSLSNLAFILCIFTVKTENLFVCGISCSLRESISIYGDSLNVSISKSVSVKLFKIPFKLFLDLPKIFRRISSLKSDFQKEENKKWFYKYIHTISSIHNIQPSIHTKKFRLQYPWFCFHCQDMNNCDVISENPKIQHPNKEVVFHQFISDLVTNHIILTQSSLR